MRDASRIISTPTSLMALSMPVAAERRIREIYNRADICNLGREVGGREVPPLIDYGHIYITKDTAQSLEGSVTALELLALEKYCDDSVTLVRRTASEGDQTLYDELGIVYSYWPLVGLHVVGLPYVRADGMPGRRIVICRESLSDVLLCAPLELLALANATVRFWNSNGDADEDADDDDEFDVGVGDGERLTTDSGEELTSIEDRLVQRQAMSRLRLVKRPQPDEEYATKLHDPSL